MGHGTEDTVRLIWSPGMRASPVIDGRVFINTQGKKFAINHMCMIGLYIAFVCVFVNVLSTDKNVDVHI